MIDKAVKKPYKKAYIEITNRCNFACSFCAPSKREKRDMSVCEFEKVLGEASELSNHVYLHVLGEPLLNSCLDEMLDVCEKVGVSVNLTTNGSLISRLGNKSAIRKVSVSLNSLKSNNVNYENYFDQLFKFIENTSAIVELRLFSGEDNSAIIDILSAKFNARIEDGKKLKLKENVYLEFYYLFDWPGKGEGRNRCLGLIDQFAVLASGEVVPCCVDYDGAMALGNAFSTSLKTILTCAKAEEIREGFKKAIACGELCKRCSFMRDKVF